MGYIIGQNASGYASTWGSLRGAFYNSTYNEDNPNLPLPPNAGLGYPSFRHNRIYINDGNGATLPPTWFVDQSGSLFRTYPESNPGLWWGTIGNPPILDGKLYFGSLVEGVGPMANEDFEEFVGKSLDSSVDSIILEEGANITGQTYPFMIERFPGFVSIEGMTVIP